MTEAFINDNTKFSNSTKSEKEEFMSLFGYQLKTGYTTIKSGKDWKEIWSYVQSKHLEKIERVKKLKKYKCIMDFEGKPITVVLDDVLKIMEEE
jgi:hypothetical protein